MTIVIALIVWLAVAVAAYMTLGVKEKMPEEKKKLSITVTCNGCATTYEKNKADRGMMFACDVCSAKWGHPIYVRIWDN